jgi:hypothetical protein
MAGWTGCWPGRSGESNGVGARELRWNRIAARNFPDESLGISQLYLALSSNLSAPKAKQSFLKNNTVRTYQTRLMPGEHLRFNRASLAPHGWLRSA